MSETEMSRVDWPNILTSLINGQDLSEQQSFLALSEILRGTVTDAQIAGFLCALAAKGESIQEVLGLRRAMLGAAHTISLPPKAIDIVGVGGSARRRVAAFNVSTVASFVAAGAGAVVCKHGNKKASSTSGSFDLLEELGVNIDISPEKLVEVVRASGLGFAYARKHHPAMRFVGPTRTQLAVPTVFNLLGPMSHPAMLHYQVIGVGDEKRADRIAEVMSQTGSKRVWVVTGDLGLDEIALTGPTRVLDVTQSSVTEFVLDPRDFGFQFVAQEAVVGGDAKKNAQLARSVFAGEASANRDMIVLNAAAALVVCGVVNDYGEAISAAQDSIDSQAATRCLEVLVAETNRSD